MVLETFTYDNIKEEITQEYIARANGKYTVRVYGAVSVREYIQIEELVEMVEYAPNGNAEYKRAHQVKLTVDEKADKVKDIKYVWKESTEEPSTEEFTESCNNGDTLTKDGLTGIWYLWTLLETESGKTNIGRSEGFNFDNTGPAVTLVSEPISETSFKLTATVSENKADIAKYEFYMGEELIETVTTNESIAECIVVVPSMLKSQCSVEVQDANLNKNIAICEARTYLYAWKVHNPVYSYVYNQTITKRNEKYNWLVASERKGYHFQYVCNIGFCSENGYFWFILNTNSAPVSKSFSCLKTGNYYLVCGENNSAYSRGDSTTYAVRYFTHYTDVGETTGTVSTALLPLTLYGSTRVSQTTPGNFIRFEYSASRESYRDRRS